MFTPVVLTLHKWCSRLQNIDVEIHVSLTCIFPLFINTIKCIYYNFLELYYFNQQD
jgi:hypothetical protein